MNDVATENGSSYVALEMTSEDPFTSVSQNDGMWALLAAAGPSIYSWKGIYVSGTTYNVNDVVNENGSSYVALEQSSEDPFTSCNNSDGTCHGDGQWALLASAGPSTYSWKGTFISGNLYNVNDVASENGSTYVALQQTKEDPIQSVSSQDGVWALLAQAGAGVMGGTGPTGVSGTNGANGATGQNGATGATGVNWQGPWNSTVSYNVDDAVSYSGSSYIAIAVITGGSLTPPSQDTVHWALVAQAGTNGSTGPTGPSLAYSTTDTANTLVERDSNGGIQGNIFNTGTLSTSVGNSYEIGGVTAMALLSNSNFFAGTDAFPASVSTGADNVGVGYDALVQTTTGSSNTEVGFSAGAALTTGTQNVAVGGFSGNSLTSGQNNIAIGYLGGDNLTTGSNNIVIGSEGATGDTEVIRIGTPGTQTAAYVAGIDGVTSSSGTEVYINSNGQLGTVTSSRRFKRDIVDMGDASRVLMDLRPVSFRYNEEIDPEGHQQYGLVAEEVEEQAPQLVVYDSTGQVVSVRYNLVNAMLLNEVQRQQRTLDQQQAIIERQQAVIDGEARELAALSARMERLEAKPATH